MRYIYSIYLLNYILCVLSVYECILILFQVLRLTNIQIWNTGWSWRCFRLKNVATLMEHRLIMSLLQS